MESPLLPVRVRWQWLIYCRILRRGRKPTGTDRILNTRWVSIITLIEKLQIKTTLTGWERFYTQTRLKPYLLNTHVNLQIALVDTSLVNVRNSFIRCKHSEIVEKKKLWDKIVSKCAKYYSTSGIVQQLRLHSCLDGLWVAQRVACPNPHKRGGEMIIRLTITSRKSHSYYENLLRNWTDIRQRPRLKKP